MPRSPVITAIPMMLYQSGIHIAGQGAPRPMKMGTTRSRWRYDAAADDALQSAKLRQPAILRYASRALFADLIWLVSR
jgi:hypothetical protein